MNVARAAPIRGRPPDPPHHPTPTSIHLRVWTIACRMERRISIMTFAGEAKMTSDQHSSAYKCSLILEDEHAARKHRATAS